MRPDKILPWLLGAALGAAGWIQGSHWRSTSPASGDGELEAKVVGLENEIALLKRENESLRSLAQGGGEVHVDPALIDFTEEALGMDFKSNPPVHRVAGEELRDRIVASIEARYGPHGLDSRQQAWALMGLLTGLLEPVILITLGVVVGLVATSMFLPLFDLTATAGGGS